MEHRKGGNIANLDSRPCPYKRKNRSQRSARKRRANRELSAEVTGRHRVPVTWGDNHVSSAGVVTDNLLLPEVDEGE